ncbi:MAG: exo-alpha-sialidase [Chloroflexi bacterium]|nr:MAG: exo-alpha-sialidase [Chloroflexota bacterium]
MRKFLVLPLTIALLVTITALAGAAGVSTLVNTGSPTAPFSENKQNEPSVAIDANHTNVLASGANDNIDMEACNAGNDTTCPFTNGVGVSGIYFSFDSGKTWTQPTYDGLTARGCQGVPGPSDPACTPVVGPIGTLPWYYENGLVSDGDPAVAFGPKPDANGSFSWANGSRLYYANLTSNLGATRSEEAFKGFEAIAVSRTDNAAVAATGGAAGKAAWKPPVVISKQSSTTFSDKEQVWADNASSSAFFGTVYVCWAAFRGQELSPNAAPAPLQVGVSHDGGDTWSVQQIGAAANNRNRNPMDGCTIRTDSTGNAYLYGIGRQGADAFEIQSISTDGGTSWSKPQPVVGPVTQPGISDPNTGRPSIDGLAGARSDLAPAPSVDIANGAPNGTGATNRIVMSYVSGEITKPHVFFTESTDLGVTWATPRAIEGATDRGYYTAPAISPDGTNVYVVYNAFTTAYQPTTATPRSLVGVFMQATATGTAATGAFAEVHRGTAGDPRGSSQNNLVAEFLGDYVYAAATRTYGVAVWNDTRVAADCPAIDAWRQDIATGGTTVARPAPQQDCAPNFGNSDIFSFTTAP